MKAKNEKQLNSYADDARPETLQRPFHPKLDIRFCHVGTSMMPVFFRPCLQATPQIHPKAPLGQSHPPFGGQLRTQLHKLKRKLLRAALEETPNSDLYIRLCRAAHSAADLAWATGEPLLVFPVLFEELAGRARSRAEK